MKKTKKSRQKPTINTFRLRQEFSALVLSCGRLWELRPLGNGQVEMPIVTATTMTAFGCEIGFKYLIWTDQEEWIDIHKLDNLFNKLSTERRDDIRSALSMNDQLIQQHLKAARDSFTEWRYFFEHDSNKLTAITANVMFLQRLLHALDQVIQQRFPTESPIEAG